MYSIKIGSDYKIKIPSTFHGYKIMKDIGKGSFSSVVLVQEQRTSKYYAAKIIPKKLMESRYSIGMIFNEIEILQKIKHQNIIEFHETFDIEEFTIIITKYYSRGNLLNFLLNNNFNNENEKKKIAIGIIESIKYLHDKRIAHCDIKLENILLDDDLNPKLCDFNLSRFLDLNQEDNKKICSSVYSAPEFFKSQNIDLCKSDIWSLGLVLFALYEKRFPYKDIDDAIYDKENLYIQTSNKYLEIVVEKCTQIDPLKRPNINDLLNEKLFTKSNHIFDYSYHNLFLMRQYMDPLEIDIILEEMNLNLYAYSRYEPIYLIEIEANYEYDEYEFQLKDEILKNKYKKQKKRNQKNKN